MLVSMVDSCRGRHKIILRVIYFVFFYYFLLPVFRNSKIHVFGVEPHFCRWNGGLWIPKKHASWKNKLDQWEANFCPCSTYEQWRGTVNLCSMLRLALHLSEYTRHSFTGCEWDLMINKSSGAFCGLFQVPIPNTSEFNFSEGGRMPLFMVSVSMSKGGCFKRKTCWILIEWISNDIGNT